MSNQHYMSPSFEREKNVKASMYTGFVCIALLIIFFFAKWTLPQIPQPTFEEGIEVNLGNSDEGLGDIAPMVPGEPAPAKETDYSPPAASPAVASNEPDISTDDNDPEAPVINKPAKTVVRTPNRPATEVANRPRPSTNPPVTNPTPAPPRPKAVYAGGTSNGTGGNNSDSYNNTRNQGIAGGNGDQGRPNGNPNSDSYSGNASRGNSGVRIRSGLSGRKFASYPSFEDDFRENAKVAVDITVDASGRVTSARVNLSGTTTTNANIRSIATRKARELKLTAGSDEQTGTIVFDFKLRG